MIHEHNEGILRQCGRATETVVSFELAVFFLELTLPATFALMIQTDDVSTFEESINLIGVDRDDRWLTIPEAELFWYGKDVRPGRKVGHLSLCFHRADQVAPALELLRPLLPVSYGEVLNWIAEHTRDW